MQQQTTGAKDEWERGGKHKRNWDVVQICLYRMGLKILYLLSSDLYGCIVKSYN